MRDERNSLSRRQFGGLTAAGLAMAATLGSGRRALAAENWNFYTPNPVELTSVKDQEAICDQIAKETNGELTIRIHLGGTLQIQPPDLTSAVADEVVQIGDDQQFGGNVPIASMLRLPTLLRSEDEYKKASDILLPYVEDAYKKFGVSVLATYYYPPLVIFSTAEIRTLADMKGKKIRTLSPESSELIKRVGATPVSLSASELAPALASGVVDAITTASSGSGIQVKDIVKYNYRLPIAFSNVYLIVNDDAAGRLSDENRAILFKDFKEGVAKTSPKIMQNEVDYTQQFIQEGMVVTEATPEDIKVTRDLMEPVWEQWAKDHGPVAVEALGKIRDAIGR